MQTKNYLWGCMLLVIGCSHCPLCLAMFRVDVIVVIDNAPSLNNYHRRMQMKAKNKASQTSNWPFLLHMTAQAGKKAKLK